MVKPCNPECTLGVLKELSSTHALWNEGSPPFPLQRQISGSVRTAWTTEDIHILLFSHLSPFHFHFSKPQQALTPEGPRETVACGTRLGDQARARGAPETECACAGRPRAQPAALPGPGRAWGRRPWLICCHSVRDDVCAGAAPLRAAAEGQIVPPRPRAPLRSPRPGCRAEARAAGSGAGPSTPAPTLGNQTGGLRSLGKSNWIPASLQPGSAEIGS